MIPLCRKDPPPPDEGTTFWHQIYPFQEISSNFGFGGRKTPHPTWGKIIGHTRSIHFRQFRATLVLVAENLPSPDEGKFLTPDLSISGNFEQLWFWRQKRPLLLIREIFFGTRSIHFRQFWATLVLVAEKTPPPMKEKFLTPDLSTSGNFEQLWFWWKKRLPRWGKKFWHQIYPFQAISSNFGFGGRKAPPPKWGEIFLHWIYPLQTILSNFGFCGRKAPLSFVPFHERHNSCYPCGIPMVSILQICTQIPPIWISSLGY